MHYHHELDWMHEYDALVSRQLRKRIKWGTEVKLINEREVNKTLFPPIKTPQFLCSLTTSQTH